MKRYIEILAPAGNPEMLSAALDAGADAVYFGVRGVNMRASSKNFSVRELKKVADKCHENDARAYLALNTIIYESELPRIRKIISKAREAGIDAIICWDNSVIREARRQDMEVHISTQASVSNYDSAESYNALGASRIIFARELTLEELKKVRRKIKKNNLKLKVEVFAHGAMCVSESGRCFMSEHLYGKSANRGECIQPCRRSYIIKDPETQKELKVENNYVLSPKDLCTLPFLEKVLPCADSLKIEGRGRSPEYVKTVVEAYKEAADAIAEKRYDESLKRRLMEKVRTVYNRGFSSGFYMSRPVSEFTDSYGSKATRTKKYLGKVKNYFRKSRAAEIKIESGSLKRGDDILVIGPTTGVVEQRVDSMKIFDKDAETAAKGINVGVSVDKLVRKNDKVYIWEKK